MNDFSIKLKDFSKENVVALFFIAVMKIVVSGAIFYTIGLLLNRTFSLTEWNLFSQMVLSVFFTLSVILSVLMAIEHDDKL